MSDTPIWNTSKHLQHTKDLSIGYFRKHQVSIPDKNYYKYIGFKAICMWCFMIMC